MKLCITLLLSLIVANGFDCSLHTKRRIQDGTLVTKFDPRVLGGYKLGEFRRNGKVIAKAPANKYTDMYILERFKIKEKKTDNKGITWSPKLLEMDFTVGINVWNYYLELSEKGKWTVTTGGSMTWDDVGRDDETKRIGNLIREIIHSFKGFLIRGSKISLLSKTGLSLELRRVRDPPK